MIEKIGMSNNIVISSPQQKSVEGMSNPSLKQQENTPDPSFSSKTKKEGSKENVENIVHSLNEFVGASSSHLKFEFHEKLKEYYVTLVDNNTKEVVREIPAKKMLDMYAAMTEYLGLMVDKKI